MVVLGSPRASHALWCAVRHGVAGAARHRRMARNRSATVRIRRAERRRGRRPHAPLVAGDNRGAGDPGADQALRGTLLSLTAPVTTPLIIQAMLVGIDRKWTP